ncbi:MAG: hypothetical protein MJ033_02475 [Victivallaceae bacterium]|nr:hypothetical protein [Victivallaceae bacterium]
MRTVFCFLAFFAFVSPLSAFDLAEKMTADFFKTANDQIETAYPGWVPGNEEKSIWCAGGEDKPTLGSLPLAEARLFVDKTAPEKLVLVAYRYASAEKKLNSADGAELHQKFIAALAQNFPDEAGRFADRFEQIQLSGSLRRGAWGEALICYATLKRGPVILLAGIYPVGTAPKRMIDFFTDAASFRYRACFDADKNALLYPVPAGAAGLQGYGFASATARLAAYYGVSATPQQIQEAVGGKEKPQKAAPAPAPAPAPDGKKKKKKKSSSSAKVTVNPGKDAANLVDTWRAIRKMESKTGISCREILDGDSFLTRNQCNKLKNVYNRFATEANHKAHKDVVKTLDFDDNPPDKVPALNPENLTKARAANKIGLNRFRSEVERMLSRGDLPLWCAMGFKADKSGKLATGAPAPSWRIICGINAKEGKLYYVDCFTALEATEISVEEAWAITLKLYQLGERR